MKLLVLLFLLFQQTLTLLPPDPEGNTAIRKEEDHIEMLPIQLDGELNKNLRQEVLLNGEEHVDLMTSDQLKLLIEKMFKATDSNSDGYLSVDELSTRIDRNTKHHFAKTRQQVADTMKLADTDKNKMISWDEMYNFLIKIDEIEEDNKLGKRMKFDTSDENHDGLLDFDELLIYLHPENSRKGLIRITQQIVNAYDKNNDSIVTRDEFINWSPGQLDDTNSEFAQMEKDENERRKQEFDEDIDTNGDGKATITELFDFVNPRNIRRVKSEVMEIIRIVDSDNDGRLTMNELLARDWILANSGLLSITKRLHDEM